MLSQLAFKLGRAFTSGRKSAPAEFQEVQNQLYSLSKALDSFKHLPSQTGESLQPADGLSEIIKNCRSTLEHLEQLVDKYLIIQEESDNKKRWREELVRNWKKIKWTTEGGDLSKLHHNLGVHITSLNLAVQAMNQ